MPASHRVSDPEAHDLRLCDITSFQWLTRPGIPRCRPIFKLMRPMESSVRCELMTLRDTFGQFGKEFSHIFSYFSCPISLDFDVLKRADEIDTVHYFVSSCGWTVSIPSAAR